MEKNKKLVIIGDSSFAQVAYEYFTYDSPYEIHAFSVESEWIKKDSLSGIPVIPFHTLSSEFNPEEYYFFVAIVYTQMNQLRANFYQKCKSSGFKPASYISKQAFVWPNASIGEHCFIFENNVIQPFVTIGNNVILWSGNHIGHHSKIGDHCFISSHVVISGHCEIGKNCFMGVNSTVSDQVSLADHTLIGAGTLVTKNTSDGSVYRAKPAEKSAVLSSRIMKAPNRIIENEME